jgi:hypothetical protein
MERTKKPLGICKYPPARQGGNHTGEGGLYSLNTERYRYGCLLDIWASLMSEWISVEDRLPEEDVPVLVVSKSTGAQYITTAMIFFEDDGENSGWVWAQLCATYNPNLLDKGEYEFDDDYNYTHWMPLHQPPMQQPQEDG